MAAISIVSGTSLNAFFHPCENLQSIAIQCAWRSANWELLSCIAKAELYCPKAERVHQANVLSCHWNGQRSDEWESQGRRLLPVTDEWTSCVLLGGPSPQTSYWHLSSRSGGRSPGLWHSRLLCWKYIVIRTALRLDSLYCQLESKGNWPNLLIFWASLVS